MDQIELVIIVTIIAFAYSVIITMFQNRLMQIELERTPEDLRIDEITQYVLTLEKHTVKLWRQAEHLVKCSREASKAMLEMGQGLTGAHACDASCASH